MSSFTSSSPSSPDVDHDLARAWPSILVGGIIGIVLGVVLILNPITTALALAWLIAIALVIGGVAELIGAGRQQVRWPGYLTGAIWIVTGILAIAWPGVTLLALAWITGIGFIIGAVAEASLVLARAGDVRHPALTLVLAGLNAVVGVAVLIWPGVTVLVLALLLGIRVLSRGIASTWFAWSLRRYA